MDDAAEKETQENPPPPTQKEGQQEEAVEWMDSRQTYVDVIWPSVKP